MKLFKLGAALLATTITFTACGDDSSSSVAPGDDENATIEESSASQDDNSSASKSKKSSASKGDKSSSSNKASSSSSEKASSSSSAEEKSSASKDDKSSASKGDKSSSSEKVSSSSSAEEKSSASKDGKSSASKGDKSSSSEEASSASTANNILKIAESGIMDICISNENKDSFEMQTIDVGTGFSYRKYNLSNDTLFTYLCKGESDTVCATLSNIFISDKHDSIYGSWTYTNCDKTYDYGELLCDRGRKVESTIEITKDTVTMESTPVPSGFANLGNSNFLEDLVEYVANGSSKPMLTYVFLPGNPQKAANRYDVTIEEATETKAEFTVKGTKVSVETSVAHKYPARINVTVSAGDATCEGEYIEFSHNDMTEDLCKADNAEFFDVKRGIDANSNDILYVSRFYKENNYDFESCLDTFYDMTHPYIDPNEETEE